MNVDILKDRERIVSLLKETDRQGIDKLIQWLEKENFFTSPASVSFHNNFEGGLAHHSLAVYDWAMNLREEWIGSHVASERELPHDSVVVSALLHDVCKQDVYYVADGKIQCDRRIRNLGHGLRSVERLAEVPFMLTEDEKLAIWWHMGNLYEPSYRKYKAVYKRSLQIPLCNLIRKADHDSTR